MGRQRPVSEGMFPNLWASRVEESQKWLETEWTAPCSFFKQESNSTLAMETGGSTVGPRLVQEASSPSQSVVWITETQKAFILNPGVLRIKKEIEKNTDHSLLIFLNTINHNDLYTTLYNYILLLSKEN